MMTEDFDKTHKIRPSGRHLITIGRDLIQDPHAAIIELVKNAYDADASSVELSFETNSQTKSHITIVKDNGHGMSKEVVTGKWLVPSTNDKINRKNTPKLNRIMQGRKGIGRYAAAILGENLLLETTDDNGETTTIYLEWADFENATYLDEVEILVESSYTGLPSGTILTINCPVSKSEWNKDNFKKLHTELKKLRPSASSNTIFEEDQFFIRLTCKDFLGQSLDEEIEPFPLVELYDYCIKGEVSKHGKGKLLYSLQKHKNTTSEEISFDLESPTGCGDLLFDIRVYDRDPDSISRLIQRGLKHQDGTYLGKLEARRLLNDNNGIGVYRNGFRIRPLGDADFDWLQLNKQRVQNPAEKIGSDQAIGYVLIQSEEFSNLIEKSARDGLKDNEAFSQLKRVTKEVLALLERKRRAYRQKSGLSKGALKIERELERLFSFDDLKEKVLVRLNEENFSPSISNKIIEFIEADAASKNKDAESLRKAIAIYQGQATLGKIIQAVIHEGRRPLNYFVNNVPFIEDHAHSFKLTKSNADLDGVINIAEGLKENAKLFSDMFKRLDPLASGSRNKPKKFNLENEIRKAFNIFVAKAPENLIELKLCGFNGIEFEGFPQDVFSLFVNLFDNSIFWLLEKNCSTKTIEICCYLTSHAEIDYIDYYDSGPGIDPELIESELIFEPNFTTKPNGMGLGLAIAGEVADRLGFNLKALEYDSGAYFRLSKKI
jgi:C4-dicarboxylate-specific signal transduction histidine kinase